MRCRRHRRIVDAAAAGDTSFTPPQIARLYQFPTALTGKGQTVAIIELGGGYKPGRPRAYFAGLGLTDAVGHRGRSRRRAGTRRPATRTAPTARCCSTSRSPARSPRARRSPSTSRRTPIAGFLDAITDRACTTPSEAGGRSRSAGAAAEDIVDAAGADGVRPGVRRTPRRSASPCAARPATTARATASTDGNAHVDFPASSPHALGCGGTALSRAANGARSPAKSSGTTARAAAPPAAASATSSRSRPAAVGERAHDRSNAPAARAAACRTSPATPIPRPATKCASTVRTPSSAAPAPWRRSGPRWSR